MRIEATRTKLLSCAVTTGALLLCAATAEATRPVGLGVGVGVAVPTANEPFKLAPAWGFYTDIPLLESFHITPSTLVYRLDKKDGTTKESATDVSLNFKFVIPLGQLALFGGVTAGATSTTELNAHVGGLAGASLNLVSNLDLFVNVGYKLILADGGNIGDLQIFAGPLIRFTN